MKITTNIWLPATIALASLALVIPAMMEMRKTAEKGSTSETAHPSPATSASHETAPGSCLSPCCNKRHIAEEPCGNPIAADMDIRPETLQPFRDWLEEHRRGEANRESGLEQALAVKDKMLELLKRAPEQAYRHALPKKDWHALPAELKPHVAYRFDEVGTYRANPDCSSEHVYRSLTMESFSRANTHVAAALQERERFQGRMKGVILGAEAGLVAMEGEDASVEEVPVTANASSLGDLHLLWLSIRYSDEANYPDNISGTTSSLNQVAASFAQWSYGRVNVTYEILEVSISSASTDNIAGDQVRLEANAAATALGKTISNYDIVLYRNSTIGNYAFLNDSIVMMRHNGYSTIVHEMGHCMGLSHANWWQVDEGQPAWGTGTNVLYGNHWDAMANGRRGDFNAHEKKMLGWLDPGTDYAVDVPSGTYRIYPYDSHAGNFSHEGVDGAYYTVSVFKDTAAAHGQAADRRYALSFRNQPEKADHHANPWYAQGIILNWEPWTEYGTSGRDNGPFGTTLIDTHPGTAAEIEWDEQYDAPVLIGETYVDDDPGNRDGPIYITPLRKVDPDGVARNGDEYMDVKIVIGNQPGNQAPTGALAASRTFVAPGESVLFHVEASDPDDETLAYHWDFGVPDTIASRKQMPTDGQPTQPYSWSDQGSYEVSVTVSDGRGGSTVRTQQIDVFHTHTVTFDLGAHGTRSGGGQLVQQVVERNAALAPMVTADSGYVFVGWDLDFNYITSDLTVTAQYRLDGNQGPAVEAGTNQSATLLPSTWTPAGQRILKAWFDASDPDTLTTSSSGQVSFWADKSGNERHAIQERSSSQPIHTPADPMMNGKPSIVCNSSSGSIGLVTPRFLARTVYVVAYYKDGLDETFDGDATLLSGLRRGGGYKITGKTGTNDLDPYMSFYTHGFFRNGTTINLANDVLPMPATLFKFHGPANDPPNQPYALGYNQHPDSSAVSGWVGGYCEWIFTDYTEDLEFQQKLEGYLAHKWGLAQKLPTDHPYKQRPAPGPFLPTAVLQGGVSDPEGDPLTIQWSKISGPGEVDFADPATPQTTATFSAVGTYRLRLTASDGLIEQSDELEVAVGSTSIGLYGAWVNDPGNFTHRFLDVAMTSDPDHDGKSNLMEFAFGTDPTLAEAGALESDGSANGMPRPISSDGSGGFQLYFLRRKDHGASGSLRYTAQFSSDLSSFTSSTQTPDVLGTSAINPDYELVKVPYPPSARFGRVQVELLQ